MKTIKVSIIATFYNLEDYVERCVDSLSSQTLQDIEIICVNDGSKDNTIRILQELAKNDNRIKIIDKKNEGVSIARNTGINAASGEYIMFVDGDDFLEIDACEKLYNKAIKSDVDIVIFHPKFIYNNKQEKDKYFKKSQYYLEIRDKIYLFSDKIYQTFKSDPLYCWNKLYNRNFIISNNILFPKDLSYGEDTVFVLLAFNANPKIIITEYYYYNYFRSRQNSLTKLNSYKFFSKYLSCANYINNIFKSKNNNIASIIRLYAFDFCSSTLASKASS